MDLDGLTPPRSWKANFEEGHVQEESSDDESYLPEEEGKGAGAELKQPAHSSEESVKFWRLKNMLKPGVTLGSVLTLAATTSSQGYSA